MTSNWWVHGSQVMPSNVGPFGGVEESPGASAISVTFLVMSVSSRLTRVR